MFVTFGHLVHYTSNRHCNVIDPGHKHTLGGHTVFARDTNLAGTHNNNNGLNAK